jgi:membrane protease YdiL (CAAX protease family)
MKVTIVKKIGHYLFYLIELAVVIELYSTLQNFYFYPSVFNFGHAEAFVLAFFTVLVFWFASFLYKSQLADKNEWGFNQPPYFSWWKLGVSALGFLIMMALYTLIMSVIGGGTSANQQDLDTLQQAAGPTYNVMVVFVGPVCEELIFRGFAINIFFNNKSRWVKWIAIVASGFAFGYVHDPTFSPFLVVYWMMGCVLGWVYMTTRDLRYSMLTHIMWNTLSVI